MIINDPSQTKFSISDYSNLCIIADFNRTLTKATSQTSWSILSQSSCVPAGYIADRKLLYDEYRPIELNCSMNVIEKNSLIAEWYKKHISLFVKYGFTKDLFISAITNSSVELRDGVPEFLEFLHENNIPLIIVSAGISNFIKNLLEINNCLYDNISVISNEILFHNGICSGSAQNIVHVFNKDELHISNSIESVINNRNNIIVLGDDINDFNVLNNIPYSKSTKIIFDLGKFSIDTSSFDIICSGNDDYKSLKDILF